MATLEVEKLKMSYEKPPVYDAIIGAGLKFNPAYTVFTYADTLYNPERLIIPEHLLYHETTHATQQGWEEESAAKWWDRYLVDQYFRVEQEVQAYGNQYHHICQYVKDRNQQAKILMDLARVLSGPTYGNVIHQVEAAQIIKKYK